MLRRAASRLLSDGAGFARVRHAEMHHEVPIRNGLRDGERGFRFVDGPLPLRVVGERVRERLAPRAVGQAGVNRRVDRIERRADCPRAIPPARAPRRRRGSRNACASRTPRHIRSRARQSRPDARDRAADRGRDASRRRRAGLLTAGSFAECANCHYRNSSINGARSSWRRPNRGYFARLART